MKSQHPLKSCNVLLISNDMEWNNAYLKSMKPLFIVNEHICDGIWQADSVIDDKQPDFIVLVHNQEMQGQDLQRVFKHCHAKHIPVIAISDNGADTLIKAGATFCTGYADMLTAVKYSTMAMREVELEKDHHKDTASLRVLSQLNQALYSDAPDPMCYVQDGLFMDANTAFMTAFGINDREILHDITLLSLVMPRSEKALKQLLKSVSDKGISSTESVDMETLGGEKRSFICTASKVSYKDEPAIQMHWRDANAGGGGSSVDATTGLMGLDVVRQAIKSAQENSDETTLGSWVYLWIENYREVWGQDGYPTAEILMKAAADSVARYMPASTVAVRFNDDALVLFATGKLNATIDRVESLVNHLQDLVPENIGRMIKPSPFAMVEGVGPQTTCEACLSNSFRAVRGLALSQGQDRVVSGSTGSISRNDERRLAILQKMLEENQILVLYQPIIHLEADGKMRFSVCLSQKDDPDQNEDVELESLIIVAERHGRGKPLDELKLNTLLRDILSFSGDQRGITGFVSFGGQALQDGKFGEWVLSQLKQTGVAPSQLVCEITLDTAVNVFSGVEAFSKQVKPAGVKIALTEIGRFDDEVTDLLSRLQPNILKLDMREIDTFEDEEEERFMNAVKAYTEEHGQTIIVDNMESPAQLSRVWPYDLQLLQGDGMVPAQSDFDYDFSEPLF